MHEDVEAAVVELCLYAVWDTGGPRVNGAMRVHVWHEYPAATLDNIIMDQESVVLGCIVLVCIDIGAICHIVSLRSSKLDYLLL